MAKRKREKKTYRYQCSLTGEKFKTTQESQNPDDLMSIRSYYELNPDNDDRPENIKRDIDEEEQSVEDLFEENEAEEEE